MLQKKSIVEKNEPEEQISELKDRLMEITAVEQDKDKRISNEESLRDLQDNMKCQISSQKNSHYRVPEEEKRDGLRKYLKR